MQTPDWTDLEPHRNPSWWQRVFGQRRHRDDVVSSLADARAIGLPLASFPMHEPGVRASAQRNTEEAWYPNGSLLARRVFESLSLERMANAQGGGESEKPRSTCGWGPVSTTRIEFWVMLLKLVVWVEGTGLLVWWSAGQFGALGALGALVVAGAMSPIRPVQAP